MLYTILFLLNTLSPQELLDRKISINCKTTVYDALKSVSDQNESYLCSENLKNQRIILLINNKTPKEFRSILLNSLNHTDKNNPIYEWSKKEDGSGWFISTNARYRFMLKSELEKPKNQMLKILNSTIQSLNTPGNSKINSRESYFSSSDRSVFANALRNITPSQIEDLIDGKRTSISFDGIDKFYTNYKISMENQLQKSKNQINALSIGRLTIPSPYISLRENPKNPWDYHLEIFGLLDKVSNSGIEGFANPIIQTDYMCENRTSPLGNPPEIFNTINNPTIIDISSIFKNKETQLLINKDPKFLLEILSKKTNIQIAQERFLKPDYFGQNNTLWTLQKGTLRDFFIAIWRKWNYLCRFENGIYYLWSPTWAFDKAADVDDLTIKRWKDRQSEREFTLNDYLDICAKFSNLQIRKTLLPNVLPSESDGGFTNLQLSLLRLISRLPKSTQKQIFSDKGIEWISIPSDIRKILDFKANSETYNFTRTAFPSQENIESSIGYIKGFTSIRNNKKSEIVNLFVTTQTGESLANTAVAVVSDIKN
jgi:hypothetical protein